MRFSTAFLVVALTNPVRAGEWKELPALPDKEGFAGMFAGVIHGTLLAAGGANFPGKKPWEGGTKVWYDTVYALEPGAKEWQVAGKLPRPLGYGVSVSHRDRVVCVGGSDAERHYADAFQLELKDGKLVRTALPSLPYPLANASGALVGETLFIAGGLEKPDDAKTQATLWSLDLSAAEPKWEKRDPIPSGGRMLALAASFDGRFWLAGGTDLMPGQAKAPVRLYLKDAYFFDPAKGWRRVADLPWPSVAAPSPAPVNGKGFYLLGGDDGTQLTVDPNEHRGFRRTMLHYDATKGKWTEAGEMPAGPVTTPCVLWQGAWVVPGGEIKPGRRTAAAWSFGPASE